MRKICIVVILFLLSMGIVWGIGQVRAGKNTELHVVCQANLNKNEDQMLALIAAHNGQYFGKSDEKEIGLFSSLLGNELAYADLRDPDQISFSFPSHHPEMSRKLIYCADNRIGIGADAVLEESAHELRLENLGATQNGYIWCMRIRNCWFYWESYLPT